LPSSLTQVSAVRLAHDSAYSQSRFDGADLANQVANGGTFDQVVFRNVSLVATRLVETRFTDVVFERCDLAGAVWHDVSFLRVQFVGCRLSAFAVNRASLVDIQMTDCRGECTSVFESEGRRWVIDDSDLPEFDSRGLRLTDARFDRCRLAKSQWGHAKLDRVAFARSDLNEVGGIAGLSRARVDTATLLTVATAIARHIGMSVTDEY
jgi:uncharacterized protein YjbI with pentapeptide repeats